MIRCPKIGCGIDENGKYHEVPSWKLPTRYIRGTVGAGDAFCAGVLYAVEMDMPMNRALKLGACTAAASLSEVSALDGVKLSQKFYSFTIFITKPQDKSDYMEELSFITTNSWDYSENFGCASLGLAGVCDSRSWFMTKNRMQ